MTKTYLVKIVSLAGTKCFLLRNKVFHSMKQSVSQFKTLQNAPYMTLRIKMSYNVIIHNILIINKITTIWRYDVKNRIKWQKKFGVESNPDYLIDAYLLAFHDVNPSWQAFKRSSFGLNLTTLQVVDVMRLAICHQ